MEEDINRLNNLKILLTALYDSGYKKIRKTLLIKLIFLIDHYLDGNLSPDPKIFGYNFYIYRYGVFTAKILFDLEKLGIKYEKEGKNTYIIIGEPSKEERDLIKENEELYKKFKDMIEKYVKVYENNPDDLSNYILENLLNIPPGQKIFYYYVSVKDILNSRKNVMKESQK